MSFDKALISIIFLLATFIQTEYQSKDSSLFDTHGWMMYTFYVALFTYFAIATTDTVRGQAQNAGNDNQHGVLTKVALLAGTLAPTMLLFIIRSVLGWVAFAFWTPCLLKIVYDQLLQVDAFVQLLQTLNNAFSQIFQNIKNAFSQLKNAVCDQTKDAVVTASLPRVFKLCAVPKS